MIRGGVFHWMVRMKMVMTSMTTIKREQNIDDDEDDDNGVNG